MARWEDEGRFGETGRGRYGERGQRWRGLEDRFAEGWRGEDRGWRADDDRGGSWRAGEERGGWRGGEDRWRGGEDRGWRGPGEEMRPGERRTYFGRSENGGEWDRDRERAMREWRGSDRGHESYGGYAGEPHRGVRGQMELGERGERGRWAVGWDEDRMGGREEWRSAPSYPGYSGESGYGYGAGPMGRGAYGGVYGPGMAGGGMTGGPYGEPGYGRGESGREAWRGRESGEHDRSIGERIKEGWQRLKGKGPKGYKRSDERIREDVCERIARSGVEAGEVEVTVESGEVTLIGFIEQRDDKRRIEEFAEDVFGVDEVHNQLRLRRATEAQGAKTEGVSAGQTPTTGQAGATGQGQPPGQPGSTQQPGMRH